MSGIIQHGDVAPLAEEILGVVMMCKAPRAGFSKTRLGASIGADAAAALSLAFMRDVADVLRGIACVFPTCFYAFYTPADGEQEIVDILGADFLPVAQQGDDLGGRLAHSVRHVFARGHTRVLVVGADSPSLPLAFLMQAVERLQSAQDVVVGPTFDGGYYLIGMGADHGGLFEGIAWSTDLVFRQTLQRVEALGLRSHVLPQWYDVDDGEDLARLIKDAGDLSFGLGHTRFALEGLDLC